MTTQIRRAAAIVLASAAAAAPASAADSFSATATPTTAGTAAAPEPESVVTELSISTDATGTPHDAVGTYVSSLPSEFTDNTAGFEVCDDAKIKAAATGGPHDPPDCPANSVLGTGALESVIPDLKLGTTTDQLTIYRTGAGKVMMWFHVSKPAAFTGQAPGTISQASSPFGPVVTWDFTSAADGSTGFKVYVKRFQTTWTPRAGSGAPPSPTPATTTTSNAKKRAACVKKAKKRYKHKAKKRRRAIRRCNKRYPKSKDRRVARAAADSSSQISPFESTGCASGKWQFEAQVKFYGGKTPDEKFDQAVDCAPAGGTAAGGGTGGGTGSGGCGLPICPVRSAEPGRRTLAP